MVIDAPTDGRDGTNPLYNIRGESKRERVEETGGGLSFNNIVGRKTEMSKEKKTRNVPNKRKKGWNHTQRDRKS